MSAPAVASHVFPDPGLGGPASPEAAADAGWRDGPVERPGLYDALAPLVTDPFGSLARTSNDAADSETVPDPHSDPFQALIADIAIQRSREEIHPDSDRRRRALLRAVAELAETHAVAADLACEQTVIDLPLEVPDPAAAPAVGNADASTHKSSLIVPDMIRTCRDRLAAYATAADRTRLDIVAALFDHILANDRLTAEVRNTLARLQLPVLRMALADDAFFEVPTHPTRRLLDRLAAAAVTWQPGTVAGARSFAALERVVHKVIRGSFEDASEHAQLLEQFERSIVDSATDERVLPASILTEPEDRDVLVIKATIQVRQLLAGIEVDREIRLFMLDVWTRVLVGIALLHVDAHRDALLARAKRLCFDLAWSAAPKTTSGERARLAGLLPTMIAAIRDGLRVIDYPEEDERRFFAEWTRVLISAVRAAPGAGFRSSERGIGGLTIDAFARRLREGSFGPETETPDQRTADTEAGRRLPDDTTSRSGARTGPTTITPIVVSELTKGEWFELREPRGFVRVRLSWVSPLRSFFLFIGADNAITRSLDPENIKVLVGRGDLRRASGRSDD